MARIDLPGGASIDVDADTDGEVWITVEEEAYPDSGLATIRLTAEQWQQIVAEVNG